MKNLISEKLNTEINNLIVGANNINRMLDRHISLLSTKFLMKETAHLLHPLYAHYFSLQLADSLAEYQEKRLCLSQYFGTSDEYGTQDYDSLNDLFAEEVTQIEDYEVELNNVLSMAYEENDYSTAAFLMEMLNDFKDRVYLANVLSEMAEISGTDLIQLDADISNMIRIIFGKDGEF